MNYIDSNQIEWKSMPVKGIKGKELFNIENGSFKKVMLEPNSSYPIHKHPNKTEFAYVLEGKLGVTIGDKEYTGESGDFFIFPVDVNHGLSNSSQASTVVLIGAVKDEKK